MAHNIFHSQILVVVTLLNSGSHSRKQILKQGNWVHGYLDLLSPSLCDLMDSSPPGSSVHGDSPGKNTGVGCHSLFQGIFPTQGLNPHLLCLLHWQMGSLTTSTTQEAQQIGFSALFVTRKPHKGDREGRKPNRKYGNGIGYHQGQLGAPKGTCRPLTSCPTKGQGTWVFVPHLLPLKGWRWLLGGSHLWAAPPVEPQKATGRSRHCDPPRQARRTAASQQPNHQLLVQTQQTFHRIKFSFRRRPSAHYFSNTRFMHQGRSPITLECGDRESLGQRITEEPRRGPAD